MTRSEGTWVIDSSDASLVPPERARLVIQYERTELPTGMGVHSGVPLAWGAVTWPDGTCPTSFQVGTPNKPGVPFVWAAQQCPATDGGSLPGFNFHLMVLGRYADRHAADPADDWLIVELGDQSDREPGSNIQFVTYVRSS